MASLSLAAYVEAVETITTSPLCPSDILQAMKCCHGGISPEEFAHWLELTASPSVVSPNPLDGGWSKNPREVHESLAGEEFEKETV